MMRKKSPRYRWLATSITAVGMLSSLSSLLAADEAAAWSRACRWTTSGVTEIPVYVNCDSFGPFGYDCDEVLNTVKLASKPWNFQGSTDIRLKLPTTTSSWGNIAGAINVKMLIEASDPNLGGIASYDCSKSVVTVFANYWWQQGTLPTSEYAADMAGILLHEFGHSLGFNHSESAAGTCGGSSYTGRAVMKSNQIALNRSRSLFYDDWIGLRSGTTGCPYTPAIPGGVLRVKQSADGGSTWTSLANWVTGSNMTPAIAWGNPSGGAGFTIQARANENNNIIVWKFSGGSWTNIGTWEQALAGPSAAFANGTFLLAWPTLQSGDEGKIMVARSSDGTSWTRTSYSMWSADRVALAFSSDRSRWYMAYADFPSQANGDGSEANEIKIVWSSDNGATWSTPYEVDGAFAEAGPGLTCPSGVSSRCWLMWPDARVTDNTIREWIFTPEADGTLIAESFSGSDTNNVPFGISGTRWITTRFDMSVVHDPSRTDVVIGFREQNAAESGVAFWLGDSHSFPPPGFSGMPGDTGYGFNSGGEAMSGVLNGVALTVDTSQSPAVILAMGHTP